MRRISQLRHIDAHSRVCSAFSRQGGFSGKPGSGGSSDPQTGYLAPVAQVALPHDVTYTFEFWLALGNLETIRAYAYAKTGH